MTFFFDILPAALGGTAAAGTAAAATGAAAAGTAAAATGAAAAGAAGAAATAAGVAGTGITLSQILTGTASLLSVFAGISGANAEADALEQQAREADMAQQTEGVKGKANQLAIKREMMDAIGQRDVAAAASGVDLSFGTAAEVRKDAFREADQALTSNTFTTMSNQSQYEQRASSLRKRAKQVKGNGVLNALVDGVSAFSG